MPCDNFVELLRDITDQAIIVGYLLFCSCIGCPSVPLRRAEYSFLRRLRASAGPGHRFAIYGVGMILIRRSCGFDLIIFRYSVAYGVSYEF